MNPKLISIIIPCFNEEQVIEKTIKVFSNLILESRNYKFEIIFINDGSTDKTQDIIEQAIDKYHFIKLISLSRNFGHQKAVSCGLDHSNGDGAVIIDADLQDPPILIFDMLKKWEEGYDVVYGKRLTRKGESFFKLFSAEWFYKILNYLTEVKIPKNTGDFRFISKNVIEKLKEMPEQHRFIRGMVAWVGFKQYALSYNRDPRYAGETKYPLKKMVKLALDGIFSFSNIPLRVTFYIGCFILFLSIILLFYIFYLRFFTDNWVEGWTAIMTSIIFLGGIQLIFIGIIGEYIGRIYDSVKKRPLYIISDKKGF